MDPRTIVVLEGDETGQELLEEALRTLAPDAIGLELDFPRFDLSLATRRATKNAVVSEAATAIRERGLGLKAATITPETPGDASTSTTRLFARDRSRRSTNGSFASRSGCRSYGARWQSTWSSTRTSGSVSARLQCG